MKKQKLFVEKYYTIKGEKERNTMEKLTTRKFIIEYEKTIKFSAFSEETQYFEGNILLNCKIYYLNGNSAIYGTIDNITITKEGYIICEKKCDSIIILLSEKDNNIIEIKNVKELKIRKSYILIEKKDEMQAIDKKGNIIFSFDGSFCWGRKETIFICNENWIITKKEKYGYRLYDCINGGIFDIKEDSIRILNNNKYGIYNQKENLVKVINQSKMGVYAINAGKEEKEIFKEIIPVEYRKIENEHEYIMAQKETGEIVYYDYDGKVLKTV